MSDRVERESLLLPILIPVGALVVIGVVLFAFSRVLLSVKPNAATAIALAASAGIMTVAAFVSSRRSVTGASLGSFVGAAAGIAMVAGGIAIVVIGPAEEEKEPHHVTLAAPEGAAGAGFSTDALSVEADVPIDLEFDNQDPGVGHNVEIFDGPDESAPLLFRARRGHRARQADLLDRAAGGGRLLLQLPAPPHHDDRHDHVAPGAGGLRSSRRTPSSTPTEIDLPADTAGKLTLDNKDPFAHNLSIYQDDTASGKPLFTFEPFSGPATKTFHVPADPGRGVLLPLRHPPHDAGHGRGRAAPARRRRERADRVRGARAPRPRGRLDR